MLVRAVEAVKVLTQAASNRDECPNHCVAAFAHSAYLRMLLGIFQGESLAMAANLKIANGSINVLDVSMKDNDMITLGPKSKLVGGILSRAPRDFGLAIPAANVVRINEIRHLEGLV